MKGKRRHALITGAGSGIGAAIARRLAEEGFAVSLAGRTRARLEAVADALPHAQCVVMDVAEEESIAAGHARAIAAFGEVEVLVNNAGIAPTAPFEKTDLAMLRRVMAVNLEGAFLLSQAVLPAMRAAGSGRIVNIASTAALKPYRYTSAYVTAKHALLGLTRALALETAKDGITVNAVCPGFTRTELVERAIDGIVAKTGRAREEVLRRFTADNPQGRLIEPEEVAALVAWLAGGQTDAVTGQALVVAGGEVMG